MAYDGKKTTKPPKKTSHENSVFVCEEDEEEEEDSSSDPSYRNESEISEVKRLRLFKLKKHQIDKECTVTPS